MRLGWMTIMLALVTCGCAPSVRVERLNYRGWSGAWRVSNATCELVIVPQISRVMHFSLRGGKTVLWVNPELAGKLLPRGDEWHNYGGEKVWPTQQSMFTSLAGRAWPPPWPWDGGESRVERIEGGVRMTLEDPGFGARLVREFVMERREARVHVRQWIEKRSGDPMPMTIWSVCQVDDPKVALLPAGRRWPDDKRYCALGDASVLMKEHGSCVTLDRDRERGLKIGVRSESEVTWAASAFPGRIFVVSHKVDERVAYPDKGCDAELYASPSNVARYTEMELLSPLTTLKPGETLRDDQDWDLIVQPTNDLSNDPDFIRLRIGGMLGARVRDAREPRMIASR